MSLRFSQATSSNIPDVSMPSSAVSGVSQAGRDDIATFEKFVKEYFDKAARP